MSLHQTRCRTVWLGVVLALTLCPRPAAAEVVFQEDFEADLGSILARWGNSARPEKMSLISDVPPGSLGTRSLELREGTGSFTYLFKALPDYEQLYLRYYVKYGGDQTHHTGASIGGYEPPTSYPQGDAGLKGIRPNGDRFFHIMFEPQGSSPRRLDFYANWIDMKGIPYQGQYYGRGLLQDVPLGISVGQWRCVEVMVKLNNPVTTHSGELALWLDGREIAHFRPGSPMGYWDEFGNWRMNNGSPGFEGFQWRDTDALGINWIKLQNFDATPQVWFDDLVLSTNRVGCLGENPAPTPPTPPLAPVLLP